MQEIGIITAQHCRYVIVQLYQFLGVTQAIDNFFKLLL